jgi:FKBP-type peptidyl-prolyl cis-trans isomerase
MTRLAAIFLSTLLVPFAALTEENDGSFMIESMQVTDIEIGTGREASEGQIAVVHYTGWLYDARAEDHKGKKFDSSVDRGDPFRFPLGDGRVIKGWDLGVQGMKVGGKRQLVIPSDLGYGLRGAGNKIPPGATLLFDIELLDVE